MRGTPRIAAGLTALSAVALGACQVLSGLSAYRETGGTAGAHGSGGGATTSTGGGGHATSTGSTGSNGSSGTGGSSGTATTGTGGCGAPSCGVAFEVDGDVYDLRAGGGYAGWLLLQAVSKNGLVGWGNGPSTLNSPDNTVTISALAMDPTFLLFLEDGQSVEAVPFAAADAGAATVGQTLPGIAAVTAAPGGAFFFAQSTDDGATWGFFQVSPGASTTVTPASPTFMHTPLHAAADGTNLYWTDATGVLWMTDPSNPTTKQMYYTSTGTTRISDLAVDPVPAPGTPGYVYWLLDQGTGGTLCRGAAGAPSACTPLTTTATLADSLAMVVDPTSHQAIEVYWAENPGSPTCSGSATSGAIRKVAVGSLMVSELATAACPRVAVDSASGFLWWSSSSAGTSTVHGGPLPP